MVDSMRYTEPVVEIDNQFMLARKFQVPVTPSKVGGMVLCGGQSRRMGQDKSWLQIDGEYLLTRVVRILHSVVQPVVVAARKDQSLPPMQQEVLLAHDAIQDGGPLVGLSAGFEQLAGKCEAVFVVTCDQPLLIPGFVLRMIELMENHEAVVIQHDGYLHSLCAVYRLEVAKILNHCIEQGVRSGQEFVAQCDARIVSAGEVGDADSALDSLRNINHQEDYEKLMADFQ